MKFFTRILLNILLLCLASSCGKQSAKQPNDSNLEIQQKTRPNKEVAYVISEIEKQMFISKALEILEISENHTPGDYEERYDKMAGMATDDMKKTLQEYRQTHLNDVIQNGVSANFKPDETSIEVETISFGKSVVVKVHVPGTRTWQSNTTPLQTKNVRYVVTLVYKQDKPKDEQIRHESWTIEIL